MSLHLVQAYTSNNSRFVFTVTNCRFKRQNLENVCIPFYYVFERSLVMPHGIRIFFLISVHCSSVTQNLNGCFKHADHFVLCGGTRVDIQLAAIGTLEDHILLFMWSDSVEPLKKSSASGL